jgi:arginyl-tRNA synthetase
MGYGAVKYADLKNSRLTNYRFSYDAMLDLKGNTNVYLQVGPGRGPAGGRG